MTKHATSHSTTSYTLTSLTTVWSQFTPPKFRTHVTGSREEAQVPATSASVCLAPGGMTQTRETNRFSAVIIRRKCRAHSRQNDACIWIVPCGVSSSAFLDQDLIPSRLRNGTWVMCVSEVVLVPNVLCRWLDCRVMNHVYKLCKCLADMCISWWLYCWIE